MRPAYVNEVFRPQGWISPVVLVGGRVAGRWQHRRAARAVRLFVVLFEPVGRHARAGLDREAERIADYLGGPLSLEWTEP